MKSRKSLTMTRFLLSASAVYGLLACPAFAETGGGVVSCSSLTTVRSLKDTTITSAKMIGADPATKTPVFCEVTGVITPAPGSRITVVYRLPESWNGKMVGLGGGGWAGNLTLDRSGARMYTAAANLSRGYATAQTDGGHPSLAFGCSLQPAALVDHSHRLLKR